jgi:hypothetical protein
MDKRKRYNESKDRVAQFNADVNEFIGSITLKNPNLFTEETSAKVMEDFLLAFHEEYYACTEREEVYIVQRIYSKWKKLNWLSL